MSQRLLVPIDGSDPAEAALRHALTAFVDPHVTLLYVIDPVGAVYSAEGFGPEGTETWRQEARAHAESLHERGRTIAAEFDATVDSATEAGRPAREIIEFAEREGIDAIVMGSHGRTGLAHAVLGSVAETVVRRATVPVTIVR